MTCQCGHSKEEHNDGDYWYSDAMEDEIWTNDACNKCGRFDDSYPTTLFRCMHYEENKK